MYGRFSARQNRVCPQAVSVVITLVYLRRTGGVALTRASFRPRRDVMGQLLAIVVPIALQDGLIQIAFIVITVIATAAG